MTVILKENRDYPTTACKAAQQLMNGSQRLATAKASTCAVIKSASNMLFCECCLLQMNKQCMHVSIAACGLPGLQGPKADLKGKASGFNLLLTSHEDEDVPFRVAQVDGNGLLHSSLHIVLLGGLAEQGLHWEGAAWDLEDWHAAKEVGELSGV